MFILHWNDIKKKKKILISRKVDQFSRHIKWKLHQYSIYYIGFGLLSVPPVPYSLGPWDYVVSQL
jgi:hypothetical protein